MKQSSAAGGRSHLLVLMTLAFPAIVEQLLLTLVRYVDTAMVGSLGANATAAVSITSSPTWLIASIMAAVGVGYSVQVAHSIGAQDYDTTAKVVRQTLLAVLVIGLSLCGICLLIAPFLPGWMGAEEAIVADSILYLQIYVLSLPFQTASYAFSAILRCMGDTRTPLVLNTTANSKGSASAIITLSAIQAGELSTGWIVLIVIAIIIVVIFIAVIVFCVVNRQKGRKNGHRKIEKTKAGKAAPKKDAEKKVRV